MRVIIPLAVLIVGITIAYFMSKPTTGEKDLPVIQPRDLKKEMVDPELLKKGVGHRIGKFAFPNQYGDTITLEDVRDNVFVAEYFFTTCKTICPIMTGEMQRVQEKFRGNPNFKILSFTVDPKVDTVEAMRAYAKKHHAESGQWHFLTGKKKNLYSLARKSFFVLKPAETKNLGDAGSDFIHTNNFVLVDQKLRIRGYYDGTNPKNVDTLMQDIDFLLQKK